MKTGRDLVTAFEPTSHRSFFRSLGIDLRLVRGRGAVGSEHRPGSMQARSSFCGRLFLDPFTRLPRARALFLCQTLPEIDFDADIVATHDYSNTVCL